MAKDQELLIKINGNAKLFIDELDKVNRRTKDLQKGLVSVAKTSAIAFTALAGAVGVAVARFSAFEKTFTNVVTLLDKSSFSTKTLKDGIEGLRKGVIALGAKSGESFETLNVGLFNLVSAGVKADDAMDALTAATKLATAGATDTNTAVKALTATMTSFGEEAGTAQEIAEKFFTAQKFGVTTVGELATEFNKVGGIAKELGISFDETLASLSALTANGAKPTTVAATELRAVLNGLILVQGKLSKESFAVQDALSLENVKARGLSKSLELLKKATNGDVVEMQRLFGSVEALGAVLSLTGAQSNLVKIQLDAMSDATARAATFQDALAVKQATTERAMKRLKVSVDAIAVTFGEAFAPTVNAAADALSAIAQRVSEMDKSTVSAIATMVKWLIVITGLTTVLAVLALGYLKVKAGVIALNVALGLSSKVIKVYNLTLLVGQRVLAVFRLGMIAATTTVRGFAAATGVGLALVAISLLITNFREVKAVVAGSLAAAGNIISNFAKNTSKIFGALGDFFLAVLAFDKNKIASSFISLGAAVDDGFSKIGEGAAKAFNTAFDESIAASDASGISEEDLDAAEAELEKEKEKIDASNAQVFAGLTEREIAQAEIDKAKAERLAARDKKSIKDEILHNKTIAQLNFALSSDEVKLAGETSGKLVALTQSKNKQVKAIGKAASLVQIGIKTAEGAISAYSALAGIPIVGPALGGIAAGAVIAFGAEQAAAVTKAQGGGIVPAGPGGARDRIPALLEPGEVVIPKALAPSFIQSVGRPEEDLTEDPTAGGQTEITIAFRDDAFEIIEQKLLERRAIGIGTL